MMDGVGDFAPIPPDTVSILDGNLAVLNWLQSIREQRDRITGYFTLGFTNTPSQGATTYIGTFRTRYVTQPVIPFRNLPAPAAANTPSPYDVGILEAHEHQDAGANELWMGTLPIKTPISPQFGISLQFRLSSEITPPTLAAPSVLLVVRKVA